MIESIKSSLELAVQSADLHDATPFETIVFLMSEIEKFKSLSGEEKQEYCIYALQTACKINMSEDEIKRCIKLVISLTKGAHAINKHSGILSCLFANR